MAEIEAIAELSERNSVPTAETMAQADHDRGALTIGKYFIIRYFGPRSALLSVKKQSDLEFHARTASITTIIHLLHDFDRFDRVRGHQAGF
jgi:hypothetical protein